MKINEEPNINNAGIRADDGSAHITDIDAMNHQLLVQVNRAEAAEENLKAAISLINEMNSLIQNLGDQYDY